MTTAVYYRLTTPDDELTGTADAIRASVRLYTEGGETRFYLSGPFASPPEYRPRDKRRRPVPGDQLCALCLRRHAGHTGPDSTRCPCPEAR